MSGQIDVLAVLDEFVVVVGDEFGNDPAVRLREARLAVAELVEADREYDAAYAAVGELRDGVSTIGEVIHAEAALHRAQSRRATALASCGGAK